MNDDKREKSDTTGGLTPGYENQPAPGPINPSTGQHSSYWVLSKEERAKGFIRPVRMSYVHLVCGTETTMGNAIAETYARDPKYYGSTFCVACRGHFPVGENGEFVWADGTGEKVGGDAPKPKAPPSYLGFITGGEMLRVQFPHCDPYVLHSPGVCTYCDGHVDWQADRVNAQILFTDDPRNADIIAGTYQGPERPCPAQAKRGGNCQVWGGNVPRPPE